MLYQRFGSENSLDYDFVVFVEQIPENTQECREVCKNWERKLAEKLTLPFHLLNVNIVVAENGRLVKLFKGLLDETNNTLLHTYSFHHQDFSNQIEVALPRNIEAKLLRTARVLLSYLTRTKDRNLIKSALKGDFIEKLAAFKQLDLTDYETETALGDTNPVTEVQKVFAFQLGQTLALLAEKEVFTKNEIAHCFPDLQPYLNRETRQSNLILQQYLRFFVQKSQEYLPKMSRLYE